MEKLGNFYDKKFVNFGNYKKLVDERNGIAHASGTIPFRTDTYLHSKINSILQYSEEIQSFSKPIIQESFELFL